VIVVNDPGGGGDRDAKLRMLLLDCHYDPYRGCVSVVQVVDGAVTVVGWCSLTASKPVLKAPMVSALEARI